MPGARHAPTRDRLASAGATVVDPVDIPSVVDPEVAGNLLAQPRGSVLSYGMKRDFDAWLRVQATELLR